MGKKANEVGDVISAIGWMIVLLVIGIPLVVILLTAVGVHP